MNNSRLFETVQSSVWYSVDDSARDKIRNKYNCDYLTGFYILTDVNREDFTIANLKLEIRTHTTELVKY